MNTLRPYKFLIIPVVQAVDEEGVVISEAQPEQPDVVFGVEALARYAAGFEAAVEAQNNASMNGTGGTVVPMPESRRVDEEVK